MYSYGQRKGGTGVAVHTQAARLFARLLRWGKADVEPGRVLVEAHDEQSSGLDNLQSVQVRLNIQLTDLCAFDEFLPVRMNRAGSHSVSCCARGLNRAMFCGKVSALHEPSHGLDQYGLPYLGLGGSIVGEPD